MGDSEPLHVVVVDDHSRDGTAGVARNAAAAAGAPDRFTIISGQTLPAGWTGKLWAVAQGVAAARAFRPDYLLLTDADIIHEPSCVATLVTRAQRDQLDLTSYMVRLHVGNLAERALIPAFVFFFFMLYPPSWIAQRRNRMAGAAGGCMLVRPQALDSIGGIKSIRGCIIDDCALAAAIKHQGGAIWLGATNQARSLRVYAGWGEIRSMISRTAFTQLRHSPLLLAATLISLVLTYVAPPALTLFAGWPAALPAAFAWALMTLLYWPTVRFYRLPAYWAVTLPAVALFYAAATLDSAVRYWSGAGGQWKGRVQDAR
jgi:hopene-associated glycosyltransferase HpnB